MEITVRSRYERQLIQINIKSKVAYMDWNGRLATHIPL